MILLMGSAGAGKGTQARMLIARKGYSYISSGEMLRSLATPGQKSRMLAGELLDDQEVIFIIDKALAGLPNADHVILDGFPRTIGQADWLLDQAEAGRFSTPVIINLAVPENEVVSRLLLRGRPDDTKTGINKRLDEYRRATLPVLDHLKAKQISVYNVNAVQTPKAVHDDVMKIIGRLS